MALLVVVLVDVEVVLAHCRERLSPYKVPERWFVADEFPLTPTQKVQKFRLAEAAARGELRELSASDR